MRIRGLRGARISWCPVSDHPTDTPVDDELPEQMRIRRAKRDRLLADGKEAYPVTVGRTHSLAEVTESWQHLETGEETQDVVTVAGRVMFVRNTGKLAFAALQEGVGTRLQVMLSLAEVGEESLAHWKADVDLGDHVAVTGRVIRSRRGELSVMATAWTMASKALRPLPVLHKELSEEARVRQRYADLVVRQEARDMVRLRAGIVRAIRETLHARSFIEIETPVLQLVHGGAAARPFDTHMNAFDQKMSLRIALELPLKKAVVGGVDKVYEMGRLFRNEGVDSTHSPEFTSLEVYEAWGDQFTMAELIKELHLAAAEVAGTQIVSTAAGEVDLGGEWRWLSFYDGLSQAVGENVDVFTSVQRLREIADAKGVQIDPAWDAGKAAMELVAELVEPTCVQPTFICDYPAIAQPLARPHRDRPGQIEAWDLFIGGVERGTAFSELIDPVIQREVLEDQSRRAAAGDDEAMALDEDFLRALEFGAPPMGGLGLGIDRLIMLFTSVGIRETILFPHLKPEA